MGEVQTLATLLHITNSVIGRVPRLQDNRKRSILMVLKRLTGPPESWVSAFLWLIQSIINPLPGKNHQTPLLDQYPRGGQNRCDPMVRQALIWYLL